jgi:alkanesulfonate monooxygenase SsuD/methylene tetrahydromethanopterin reductase-like flavin-dependent oxidoreductase (luciferase family)
MVKLRGRSTGELFHGVPGIVEVHVDPRRIVRRWQPWPRYRHHQDRHDQAIAAAHLNGDSPMPERKVLFGAGLGAWNGVDVADSDAAPRTVAQADGGGLDFFTLADHPYFGDKLDAYATLGFLLGQTTRITGVVSVTNLPSRPAPVLARTITSLSALSGGRVVLGLGAGGLWDMITRLGVPRLAPGAAVRAMEEAITLIRAMSGGGDPVTFDGEFYRVSGLDPAPVPAPPVWTGSGGPKSLAVTGRLADGWVPQGGADWLSARYLESRPRIDEAAVAAGRDPSAIVTVYNFGGRITAAPLAATRGDDGRWIGGSVSQWVDELTSAVLEHGAAGFVYRTTDDTPRAEAVARFAREIVPAVREAVTASR